MEKLPPLEPVPSPAHNVWREIRVNILPGLIFLAVLAVVALLWVDHISAPSVQAEVETIHANVTSIQPGTVLEVKVKHFDMVKAGDPIVKVSVLDPDLAKADLAVILGDLKVMQVRMAQDQTRNELNYVQLRLSLVTAEVDLAMAKVRLQQAEGEFQRVSQLYQDKVLQASDYEVALRDRDSLRDEVAGKTRLVAATAESLKRFALAEPAQTAAELQNPINQSITANEEKLRVLQGPTVLKAPIDGAVSVMMKSAGEKVVAGEIIATIVSTRSDRIVGFIRLPLNTEPKVGQRVKVITRGVNRQTALSSITDVGGGIEVFAAPLRIRGLGQAQGRGLPFAAGLPKELKVRPGELVDVIFISK